MSCCGCLIDCTLLPNRILGAVAVPPVPSVVKKRVDGLVAFQVNDPESMSTFDLMHPPFARRQSVIIDCLFRLQLALGINQCTHKSSAFLLSRVSVIETGLPLV